MTVLCDYRHMNVDDYQDAVEEIKHDYEHRINALLTAIGYAAIELGWQWDGSCGDRSCDSDSNWVINVTQGSSSVDFTFAIVESLRLEDSTDGINFTLRASHEGGYLLGIMEPCNFTNGEWVDVSNRAAIEKRFSLFTNKGPDAFVEWLSPPKDEKRRHRLSSARLITEPHGLCDRSRICLEHRQDKSVKSCKPRTRRPSVTRFTEAKEMPVIKARFVQFTKRTGGPKLRWLELRLDEAGIAHRRNGSSFHAPILEVDKDKLDASWAILSGKLDDADSRSIDDMDDEDPYFLAVLQEDDPGFLGGVPAAGPRPRRRRRRRV